jgi:hypothetical protein
MVHNDTVALFTVPLFTGAIGYATNWTGVWMLFYPVRFWASGSRGWRPWSSLRTSPSRAAKGRKSGRSHRA